LHPLPSLTFSLFLDFTILNWDLQIVYAFFSCCAILPSETKLGGTSMDKFIPYEKLSKKKSAKLMPPSETHGAS